MKNKKIFGQTFLKDKPAIVGVFLALVLIVIGIFTLITLFQRPETTTPQTVDVTQNTYLQISDTGLATFGNQNLIMPEGWSIKSYYIDSNDSEFGCKNLLLIEANPGECVVYEAYKVDNLIYISAKLPYLSSDESSTSFNTQKLTFLGLEKELFKQELEVFERSDPNEGGEVTLTDQKIIKQSYICNGEAFCISMVNLSLDNLTNQAQFDEFANFISSLKVETI